MRSPVPLRRLIPGMLLGLPLLCPASARAQILFYDTNGTIIKTDVSGNDLVFGRNNTAAFAVAFQAGAIVSHNPDLTDGYDGIYLTNKATINASAGTFNGTVATLDTNAVLNISGGTWNNAAFAVGNSAKLNIVGGALSTALAPGNSAIALIDSGIFSMSGGTLTVNGASDSANSTAVYTNTINTAFGGTAKITINGGYGIAVDNLGSLTVSGGTITAKSLAFNPAGNSDGLLALGTAKLTGGTVTGDNYGVDFRPGLAASSLSISGTASLISVFGAGVHTTWNTTISGGTITGLTAAVDANQFATGALNITGGTLSATGAGSIGLVLEGSSTATWSGGKITGALYDAGVWDSSVLQVKGTTLAATAGSTARRWDGTANYYGSIYNLTGKLSDGGTLANKIWAGGVSGSATGLSFAALNLAPSINVTADVTLSSIYNDVTVNQPSVHAPVVTMTGTADIRNVNLNKGTLNVTGGIIRDTITNSGNNVNVTGGQINNIDHVDGSLKVSNGTISTVTMKQGATTVSGGTVGTLNINQGTALVSGGTFGQINMVGNSATSLTDASLLVSGGTVQSLNLAGETANITGGSLSTISENASLFGVRSVLNLRGGTVSGGLGVAFSDANLYGGTMNSAGVAITGNGANIDISGGTWKTTGTASDAILATGSVVNVSGANTVITGGKFAAAIEMTQGNVHVSGGTISGGNYGIHASGDNAVNISGGSISATNTNAVGLFVDGTDPVTPEVANWSGGKIAGTSDILRNSLFSIAGTNLANTTPTASKLFETGIWKKYVGNLFTLTGTLVDGSALNNKVFADSVTGDTFARVFVGAKLAPDLNVFGNSPISGVYNNVFVSSNSNANPTATIGSTSDLVYLQVNNASHVKMTGGTIRGDEYQYGAGVLVHDAGTLTMSGGTISNGKTGDALDATNAAVVNISGGSISGAGIDPANPTGVGINAGGSAIVNISGTTTTITGLHGLEAHNSSVINFADATLTGGLYAYDDSLVNITSGKLNEVFKFDNAVINITGGIIGRNTLYTLREGLSPESYFNLFGSDFRLSHPHAGVYDGEQGYYWNLTGTLQNGDQLSTHYFEAGAGLGGPEHLHLFGSSLSPAAPEPPTLVLLLVAGSVTGIIVRRRSRLSPVNALMSRYRD